eukprot:2806470-Rhodomonas_salina.1
MEARQEEAAPAVLCGRARQGAPRRQRLGSRSRSHRRCAQTCRRPRRTRWRWAARCWERRACRTGAWRRCARGCRRRSSGSTSSCSAPTKSTASCSASSRTATCSRTLASPTSTTAGGSSSACTGSALKKRAAGCGCGLGPAAEFETRGCSGRVLNCFRNQPCPSGRVLNRFRNQPAPRVAVSIASHPLLS